MSPHSFFICLFLTFSLFINERSAIYIPKYDVVNLNPKSPGGIKFDKIIGGVPYTKELMSKINKFVVSTLFQQTNPDEQRKHENDTVHVYINDVVGTKGVTISDNKINITAGYIDGIKGDLKWEFTSVMYHEFTHVLAWLRTAPSPVKEGVAEYATLKANYFAPGFAKPGSGDKWDQGFDFTARFYEYCDSITPGFVAKLNRMGKDEYNVKYFKDITGKPVEQLWKDYKAKYAKKDINT